MPNSKLTTKILPSITESWEHFIRLVATELEQLKQTNRKNSSRSKELLNHILPESKIGNLKRSNSNYNKLNKNLSLSYSSLTGRKKTKTPIRKSSIYGINNFEETSNKLIRINCPIISKILYF